MAARRRMCIAASRRSWKSSRRCRTRPTPPPTRTTRSRSPRRRRSPPARRCPRTAAPRPVAHGPIDRQTGLERRTEPVERRNEPVERPTEPVERHTEPVERRARSRLRQGSAHRAGRREGARRPGHRQAAQPAQAHRAAGRAPLPVAVTFATLWAAALSYLRSPPSSVWPARWRARAASVGAAHAGLAGWLLGHGVPIGTSIGELGLAPLVLTMLVVWRLNRAGLHVTRAIGARRSGSIGQALLVASRPACSMRCSARWPRSASTAAAPMWCRPAPRSTSSCSAWPARWPGRCAAPMR